MIIDGVKLKRGDSVLYRGYVADYEGDDLGTFVLAEEDNYEHAISFPDTLERIISDVDDELGGSISEYGVTYELVVL